MVANLRSFFRGRETTGDTSSERAASFGLFRRLLRFTFIQVHERHCIATWHHVDHGTTLMTETGTVMPTLHIATS